MRCNINEDPSQFPPLVRINPDPLQTIAEIGDVPLYPGKSFICYTNTFPEGTINADFDVQFVVDEVPVISIPAKAGHFGCAPIQNDSQTTFYGALRLNCVSGGCRGAATLMSCHYENMSAVLESLGINPYVLYTQRSSYTPRMYC